MNFMQCNIVTFGLCWAARYLVQVLGVQRVERVALLIIISAGAGVAVHR